MNNESSVYEQNAFFVVTESLKDLTHSKTYLACFKTREQALGFISQNTRKGYVTYLEASPILSLTKNAEPNAQYAEHLKESFSIVECCEMVGLTINHPGVEEVFEEHRKLLEKNRVVVYEATIDYVK